MRRLTVIILLILFAILASAQVKVYRNDNGSLSSYPVREKKFKISNSAKSIITNTLSIGFSAAGDAENHNGNKVEGHLYNALGIGFLIGGYVWMDDMDTSDKVAHGISYALKRAAEYDLWYNSVRGLDLNYIGDSSLWDKWLQSINPPGNSFMFARVIFEFTGDVIAIQQIK